MDIANTVYSDGIQKICECMYVLNSHQHFRGGQNMAKTAAANELLKLVKKLQDERASHVKAIEAIDLTFQQLGIGAAAPAVPVAPAKKSRRGRPKGSVNKKTAAKAAAKKAPAKKTPAKKSGKRTRKTFEVSGDESVLAFVKANAGCSTAQVNEHWTTEGRSGKADNALGKLVKEGKIKRKNIKGQRGSTYSAK
tara:strand:+ start:479 stop:1060 length:582 start_codon:yes stop_codon:yes gene_type:complete